MDRQPPSPPLDAQPIMERSSLHLKVLLETIPDLVWVKDPRGVYLECNPRFQAFFGRTREEILGHTDFELWDQDLAAFFRSQDEAAVEAGKPRMNEEKVLDRSKNSFAILETIKTPLKGADGTVWGVLGIARDITERKELENVLRRRLDAVTAPSETSVEVGLEDLFDLRDLQDLQDQFASAFNVASIITRTDGTPLTRPSNFSEFCRLVRTTAEGRQRCFDSDAHLGRFNPTGPNVSPCLSGGLWDAGVPIIVGNRQVAKWLIGQVRDGTQTEADIIAYARRIGVDEQGLVESFREVPQMPAEQFAKVAQFLHRFARQIASIAHQNLLQARQIRERKQHEEDILRVNRELQASSEALARSNEELAVAARRAEESDRLKSAFLANMSHEIRTPLNAILGFSSILGDPGFSREETAHFTGIIIKSGENLLDLINNIIDLSKLDAGLTTLKTEPTDINNLLKSVFEIQSGKLRNKGQDGLQLKLTLPISRPFGLCDPTRLRQVLDNLVNNALKFTHEGMVELGCSEQPGSLCFWVHDTGVGIDPQHHEAIFERFRQATSDTEKLYGGTGLGLSIVRSCVEMMGGRIWVESALGEGAKFTFEIPFAAKKQSVRPAPGSPAAAYRFHGQHILIAEDDPANFEYLRTVLKDFDLRISHTSTGRSTVEAFRSHPDLSLILMDVRMPDGDGLQATREIRHLGARLPIIAQTAFAFSSDRERCLSAGCDDFLPKPTKKAELLKVLDHYLSPASSAA